MPRDPSPEAKYWKGRMDKMSSNRDIFKKKEQSQLPLLCRIFVFTVYGLVSVVIVLAAKTYFAGKETSMAPSKFVLPNVLMIGAQRAGTAEFSEWLLENGVCPPQILEDEPDHFKTGIQFFDQKQRYEEGLEYYSKRYEHCRNETLILDATPNTLTFPDHVEATYKQAGGDHLKNLKVVAILREPVIRELSLYNNKEYAFQQTKDKNQWYSDVGKDDGSAKSFDEYLDVVLGGMEPTEWGIGNMGLYAEHLKKWFSFVDRNNFLVISYEEVEQDHEKVDHRIRNFLGQEFAGSSKGATERPGVPSCSAQERLNKVFGPMNEELYKLLMENPGPFSEQFPFPTFKNAVNCGNDMNALPVERLDASAQVRRSLRAKTPFTRSYLGPSNVETEEISEEDEKQSKFRSISSVSDVNSASPNQDSDGVGFTLSYLASRATKLNEKSAAKQSLPNNGEPNKEQKSTSKQNDDQQSKNRTPSLRAGGDVKESGTRRLSESVKHKNNKHAPTYIQNYVSDLEKVRQKKRKVSVERSHKKKKKYTATDSISEQS